MSNMSRSNMSNKSNNAQPMYILSDKQGNHLAKLGGWCHTLLSQEQLIDYIKVVIAEYNNDTIANNLLATIQNIRNNNELVQTLQALQDHDLQVTALYSNSGFVYVN